MLRLNIAYFEGKFPHLGEGGVVTTVPAAAVNAAPLLVGETVTVPGEREREGEGGGLLCKIYFITEFGYNSVINMQRITNKILEGICSWKLLKKRDLNFNLSPWPIIYSNNEWWIMTPYIIICLQILLGIEGSTNVGVTLTYSLRHWEFLQLQCLFFPVTEALAAATVCASIIPLEDRDRELEGRGGGGG